MTFKKRIWMGLIGFALCLCLLTTLGQPSALATTLQARAQTPEETLNLESGIDRFLASIPSGYYTIATVESLKRQLENPQTVLVDVREASEYRTGHIARAVNIPLRSLGENLNKIPQDQPVVLYCSSGYRSAMGVMTLHLLGYEQVFGFPPSLAGWKAAGEKIEP